MPPLLVAQQLSKSYVAGLGRCWARVQVLSALSLVVHPGERVVITGPRGAGKTTLLHCLTGLRRPDAGTVRWDAGAAVPYQLCAAPDDLERGARTSATLAELPDEPRLAGEWLDALHRRQMTRRGWIVFATRPGALTLLAHRVLHLHEGALLPADVQSPLRVAEPPRQMPVARELLWSGHSVERLRRSVRRSPRIAVEEGELSPEPDGTR